MITIINFLFAAIKAGAPLLLGTTGEIVTEKSGSLNLGVEGMMYMGAIGGFYMGLRTNSVLIALLSAFATGAFGALIYAFITVTLQANQNVTGLTLTIFGTGFANFFGEMLIKNTPSGTPKLSSEFSAKLSEKAIPVLSDIPYIGKLLFSHNYLVYFSIIVALLCWAYIKYTRFGLNMRFVGENPAAADASGLSVNRIKYINILIGGGICGLGGAYISLINGGGVWNNGAVNGQGWIAVALVIFASWSPAKAIIGSLIFGAFSVFQFRAADFAALFRPLGFLTSIPAAFYNMLPFVLTAVVLIVTSMRKRKGGGQPASCGVNYFREER
ncbi:MAG TPA: ABC transporter permease [Clostridia bacterium]|nr:ABC transporter permease [Clostridia bacterium]